MTRLNITIPDKLAEKIRDFPNKSSLIAKALEEKLREIAKEKLDKALKEGYKATNKENRTINAEWDNITLEGWK